MKVIILAAGRSNRMKPIQDKNFLMFCGKPLIEHQLEQLYEAGLRDFIIIGGQHNLKRLQDTVGPWTKYKGTEAGLARVNYVEQQNLDEGMAGAIKSAHEYLDDQGILIVSSNDIVDTTAYRMVIDKAQSDEASDGGKGLDGLIVGRKVQKYFPGGYLTLREDQTLADIVEKPGAGNEPSDLINLVIHYYKNGRKFLDYLNNISSNKDDLYETALAKMLKEGYRFEVIAYEGFWQAIKYPWHILDAAAFFFQKELKNRSEKISSKAQIASNAVIKGDVIIEDGVRIFENAVIQGPCYVGKNVVIANNALVRESFLGAGCVVGYITEIARSFLGENVWTHSNYIGDSIIGNNVSFGAGTVTGNLRLDEKNIVFQVNGGDKIDTGKTKFGLVTGDNVRCGINISFMPGIKIGNNTFVGAGVVIAQDIEDNKFVYGKTELVIKENTATLKQEAREKMMKKLN